LRGKFSLHFHFSTGEYPANYRKGADLSSTQEGCRKAGIDAVKACDDAGSGVFRVRWPLQDGRSEPVHPELIEGAMKKSIGDNMIPKGWSFQRGLELIKRAGYDGVELWLGDQPWFTMATTDAEVHGLRSQAEAAGLAVSNVSTGLHWKFPLSARDPKIRLEGIRIVERQIQTARILGTDAVLVVAGLVTEEVPYNEVYLRTLDALKQLAPQAAKAGVKIGCENCNAEQRFLMSPREFAQFLDEVNSPNVGIHLDVGNIHDTGFAEQWIEIHGPRITRIHLKDVLKHRGRCGHESVYTNLFLGDNNWPAIRAALAKVGYDGWLIAEMEARYSSALDQQFFDTSAAMDRLIAGKL
jgi:L-ribulose-5-phosphate 3-epimerase